MWIAYAAGSALFAGITSILAKCGIRKTSSNVATAIRTVIVLIFSWILVFVTGAQKGLFLVDAKTWLFLVLSGLATGASWLCYFKALQLGDINKVVPVDKSSTVLTIILAFLFLGEPISLLKALSVLLIAAGTYLMIQKKEKAGQDRNKRGWFFFALLSAVFASLTAILGKIGISSIDSNLGTAVRTVVVLVMAWLVVFVTGEHRTMKKIPGKEILFLILSGFATGASWLCYYRALKDGPASAVVPIDKLSILVTIGFSYLVFHEKLSKKSLLGLILLSAGTLLMIRA